MFFFSTLAHEAADSMNSYKDDRFNFKKHAVILQYRVRTSCKYYNIMLSWLNVPQAEFSLQESNDALFDCSYLVETSFVCVSF